jgi:hypothetical protein
MECVMKRKWIKQVKGETHEPRGGPHTIKRELHSLIPILKGMFPFFNYWILPKQIKDKAWGKGKYVRVGWRTPHVFI